MKLVVFGASGRVGGSLVRQALAEGHQVVAAVRRPPAVPVRHERLDVVPADVLAAVPLTEPVTGAEAVVFAVGSPDRSTTLLYSDGVCNVVEAMRAAGVRRLICLSSTIVDVPRAGLAYRLWTRFVTEKVLRNRLLDMARMEAEVRDTGLEWTVVRLPRLRAGSGEAAAAACRTAVGDRLDRPRPVAVHQAAQAVLRCLGDPATYRATVEIGA